jgi:hypothetical protein
MGSFVPMVRMMKVMSDSPWQNEYWWTEERQVFARHEHSISDAVNVQANEVCATRFKE